MKRITNRDKRRGLAKQALPAVRTLVKKYDLAAVNKAVFMIYEERRAEAKLRKAELEVEALRKKIGQ